MKLMTQISTLFNSFYSIKLIRERTKAIEEESKRREKLLKANGNTISTSREVDELLINAIQAKLALLENI